MDFVTWKFCEQKVFVYRNLHKACWSVKSLTGRNYGRVILHCKAIDLNAATFKVNEKGRQRVIAEQAKNVHAGVVGFLNAAVVVEQRYEGIEDNNRWFTDTAIRSTDTLLADDPRYREVTYNPYKFNSFVFVDGEQEAAGKFDVTLTEDMKVMAIDLNEVVAQAGGQMNEAA